MRLARITLTPRFTDFFTDFKKKKTRLFCSLTYWISMTLRDQIRSDPGRICSRITAWDQALWWGTGEFVIVLDSCCISIGLVFIKDRPVSSFWVLRFRDLGVFVFEFWVLRFRDRVFRFRFRVLRFRDLGASCFGTRFRVLRFRNYRERSRSREVCQPSLLFSLLSSA